VSFDPDSYRAAVRLDGSGPRSLADIHANRLTPGAFVAGRRILIDTGDHNDLEDAVIIATWAEAGPDFPDVFYAFDGTTGQTLSITAVTLNLDQNPQPGTRYSLASDVVTFGAVGTYRVTAEVSAVNTDTAGTADAALELTVEEDTGAGFAAIPEAVARNPHRELIDASSCSLSFVRHFNQGDELRVQVRRSNGGTNIEIESGRLIIEFLG
jgi:hypothetical protein